MIYLLIKSLHILAVMLWVGSLCLLSYLSSKSNMSAAQMSAATRLTEASIGFTWLAGVVLVIIGGWYASSWWQIKVALVVIMSAIHTILHRRWRTDNAGVASTHRAIPYVLVSITLVVVLLAVYKLPT